MQFIFIQLMAVTCNGHRIQSNNMNKIDGRTVAVAVAVAAATVTAISTAGAIA